MQKIFERRYGMDFVAFKQAWEMGQIPSKHSLKVEQDYWRWEAAVTDKARLQEMLEGQRIFGADNTGGRHIHLFPIQNNTSH